MREYYKYHPYKGESEHIHAKEQTETQQRHCILYLHVSLSDQTHKKTTRY